MAFIDVFLKESQSRVIYGVSDNTAIKILILDYLIDKTEGADIAIVHRLHGLKGTLNRGMFASSPADTP